MEPKKNSSENSGDHSMSRYMLQRAISKDSLELGHDGLKRKFTLKKAQTSKTQDNIGSVDNNLKPVLRNSDSIIKTKDSPRGFKNVRMLIVEEINGNKNYSIVNASDDHCGSKSVNDVAIVRGSTPEKIKISSGKSVQVKEKSRFVCHNPDDLTLKGTSFADMHKCALFQTAAINIIPTFNQIWPAQQTLTEETDKSDKSEKLLDPKQRQARKPRLSIIVRSPSHVPAPAEDDLDLSKIVN